MRHAMGSFSEGIPAAVHRVVAIESLAAEWRPDLRFLALIQSPRDKEEVLQLNEAGLRNVAWVESVELEIGDVVAPRRAQRDVAVLYRPSDVHHALFLTNRCNSNCLMCSQPPTHHDDSWLIDEALQVVRHIERSPRRLGLTGGEPLLLGEGLAPVVSMARTASSRNMPASGSRRRRAVDVANWQGRAGQDREGCREPDSCAIRPRSESRR